MGTTDILEKVLKAYEAYYNVDRDTPKAPFVAEASFHSHDEQFFLVRSATIGEAESNEYVFFAVADKLDEDALTELDSFAWEKGLARVKPHANHRNTDVTLVVISREASEGAMKLARKLKHYKSYKIGFQGWSHYRLVVLEAASGEVSCNYQGESLKKLFNNILK